VTEHPRVRTGEDRREGWGNCKTCPGLSQEGFCGSHAVIVERELSAKTTRYALLGIAASFFTLFFAIVVPPIQRASEATASTKSEVIGIRGEVRTVMAMQQGMVDRVEAHRTRLENLEKEAMKRIK
jgi:hypothetical protein